MDVDSKLSHQLQHPSRVSLPPISSLLPFGTPFWSSTRPPPLRQWTPPDYGRSEWPENRTLERKNIVQRRADFEPPRRSALQGIRYHDESADVQPIPPPRAFTAAERSTGKESDSEDAARCRWATCTQQFSSFDELLPHVSISHLSGNRCGKAHSNLRKRINASTASPESESAGAVLMYEYSNAHGTCSHSDRPPNEWQLTAMSNDSTSEEQFAMAHACKWALCNLSNFVSVDQLFDHLRTDHLRVSVTSNRGGVSFNAALANDARRGASEEAGSANSPFFNIVSPKEWRSLTSDSAINSDRQKRRRTASPGDHLNTGRTETAKDIGEDDEEEPLSDDEDHLFSFVMSRPRRRSTEDQLDQQAKVSTTAEVPSDSSPLLEDVSSKPHGCLWVGCKERFPSFDGLTTHVSETHVGVGKSSYACRWIHCEREGKPFPQRQKVMRHIQTHTGDKPYECTICNQRFSEHGVMAQHKRTHTGEKPFTCPEPECHKSFAIPGALTIHIRTHTGEKPFACQEEGCGRRFAESSNLTKHLRVHTGQKPFQCPVENCTKRFARPDQVKRHRRTHEKNLPK